MIIRRMSLGPLGLGLILTCTACISTQTKISTSKTEAKANDTRLLDEANQYARDGLYREAISAFKVFLDRNPDDAGAHRTIGIIYVKSGSYKLATAHLEKASTSFPTNFELNFYLGEAYRMQDRYADAIYNYKRALDAEPKSILALKSISWSYYHIRFYSEALRTSKQLRKLAPNDFQVAIIMARVLNKISMNDRALTLLNRAEALAIPDNLPFLWSVKGDILLSDGQRDAAEQAYRKALQDQPLLPGALMGLARKFLEEKKDYPLAITYLERALRIRPSLVEAYYLLGKAYQKSDPDKANGYFKTFAKEASYDPEFQKELSEIRPALNDNKSSKKNDVSSRQQDLEELF